MRIVSLLPSATEIICALGLEDNLVGVSHECDYPTSVQKLPKVTQARIPQEASSRQIDQLVRQHLQSAHTLYTLDLPLLTDCKPDLIVTQALCNVCAVAEEEVQNAACMLPGNPRIINLEPQTLSEIFASILQVAKAAGLENKGESVVAELRARVERVVNRTAKINYKPRVAMLEWIDPPFASGHWNPELVQLAGGIDELGKVGKPSRTLNWKEISDWQPEVVFISCCGFDEERTLQELPALQNIPEWNNLPAVQNNRVYVTNGAHYFSRPGPRLVDSLEILAHTLHPETHPLPEGLPEPICVYKNTLLNQSL